MAEQRERDRVTQALLLERLRHKGYERRGTLACWFQTIGDGIRSGHGPWFWLFVTLALGGYMGFYGVRH